MTNGPRTNSTATTAQARHWLLTINDADDGTSWIPPTSIDQDGFTNVVWLRGQKEIGAGTGRPHWQLFASFKRAVRLAAVKSTFGARIHAEPSRSEAAEAYVFKDDTAVAGTRFELGSKPMKRNSKTDWDEVRIKAIEGRLDQIESSVFVPHYRNLKLIAMDNMVAPDPLNGCAGLWIYGPPGTGKTHFAREHYGQSLYLKAQNKWWDGYKGQKNVLLDDFDCRNLLSHHLKLWADRYPFTAECKGSSISIRPEKFIITSNYLPEQLIDDPMCAAAVRRRFYFIHIPMRMG